jgi:Holliday junction resolvasome RuvABC endonuclease subunit
MVRIKRRRVDIDAAVPNVLSVDPGLSGTGFAVWSGIHWKRLVNPIETGVLTYDDTSETWSRRGRRYFDALTELCQRHDVGNVFVEWPNYRPTAAGQMVAGSGDLGKLFFAASLAMIVPIVRGFDGLPVPVVTWKGQLTKQAVISRIKTKIGVEYTSHDADAVGIGLWAKGFFG